MLSVDYCGFVICGAKISERLKTRTLYVENVEMILLFFLISIVSCAQFSQNELQSIFGWQKCIKGKSDQNMISSLFFSKIVLLTPI